jgi:hypothetical protein
VITFAGHGDDHFSRWCPKSTAGRSLIVAGSIQA